MLADMKTAIYCRTSTNKQDKGLESQVRYLSDHCNQKGMNNFLTYSDFGISGKKSSRPGLNKLMSDTRSGKIKTIIVYSFSRFARSTQHLLQALEEFNRLDVTFISVSENIDTNTPMGKAMFTIISALAQLERELIVERVKLGLANAKAKGKKLGRSKTRDSDLIQELRLQGYSYRKIAQFAKCSISTVHRELSVPKVQI